MKLPDFTKHEGLNALREKLGASLNLEYDGGCIWDPTSTQLTQNGELGGLDLQDISISSDNSLEYRGKKIVLYVREQQEQGGEGLYQYHFLNCATVQSWKEQRLYNGKYVANTFADFVINKTSMGRVIQRNLRYPLTVCKNCLKEFNYKDYNNVDYTKKNFIYKSFSREEYFGSIKV